MEQQKQQDVQNNAQAQQQSAQLAAQAEQQIQDSKLEHEKQLAEFQAIQDMKVEFVRGAFQIAAKSDNPQIPTWLTPVLNQIIPGITIPLQQENQAMIQGMLAQQQQQQQMTEQAQAEGEDGGQEMQEQQMIQQQ